MAKIQIIGGGFQDSEGNLLANGYLEMVLSQDCQVAATGQICSGITVKVPLDANGNVSGTVNVWPNDQLLPANNFYTVKAFSSKGQLVWGPNVQQILGAGPFNLDTWVPNQLVVWTPTLNSPPTLQTKGVTNSVQNILNLDAGVMIDLTDNGGGQIIFDVLPEYNLYFTYTGKPTASQHLYHIMSGQLNKIFDNSTLLSVFISGASPTADATFSFDLSFDLGTTWNAWTTLTIHPTLPVTFTRVGLGTFLAGNGSVIRVTAPAIQDATLSNLDWTITGSQT